MRAAQQVAPLTTNEIAAGSRGAYKEIGCYAEQQQQHVVLSVQKKAGLTGSVQEEVCQREWEGERGLVG